MAETVHSNHFYGNIQELEVCLNSLENKCKNENNGCKKLHCPRTFHWQFGYNGKWYNFCSEHSDMLQRFYSDVDNSECVLPSLNNFKLNKLQNNLRSLLGNVDFVEFVESLEEDRFSNGSCYDDGASEESDMSEYDMFMKCRDICYSVRVITTASSVCCGSSLATKYKWYYHNDEDEWDPVSALGISWVELEKAYLRRTNRNMVAYGCDYYFDAIEITLENLSYRMCYDLRRVPIYNSFRKNAISQAGTTKENVKVEMLDNQSDEARNIITTIKRSLPMITIEHIYRIQNDRQWSAFENGKKVFLENSVPANIQTLFSGFGSGPIGKLVEGCLTSQTTKWHNRVKSHGEGEYFHTSSADVIDFCYMDEMNVFTLPIYEVILGTVTGGRMKETRAPIDPVSRRPYDSTTDNQRHPTLYVKYNDQQYYFSHVALVNAKVRLQMKS